MLLLEGISYFYKFNVIINDLVNYENWPQECFTGKKQSPINIESSNAIRKKIPPIQFINYDVVFDGFVENTGDGVKIHFDPIDDQDKETIPYIKGASLESDFVLDNLHFHWQAEHSVDGYKYPLEGHFVHYNKECSCLKDAIGRENGIVVLAVFYEVSKCGCDGFSCISDDLRNVSDKVGCPETATPLSPKSFLPRSTKSFYMYEGSLTTPPCTENVTFIVFSQPSRISKQQLDILTNMKNADAKAIEQNCRPVQELEGRDVFVSATFWNGIHRSIRKLGTLFWG